MQINSQSQPRPAYREDILLDEDLTEDGENISKNLHRFNTTENKSTIKKFSTSKNSTGSSGGTTKNVAKKMPITTKNSTGINDGNNKDVVRKMLYTKKIAGRLDGIGKNITKMSRQFFRDSEKIVRQVNRQKESGKKRHYRSKIGSCIPSLHSTGNEHITSKALGCKPYHTIIDVCNTSRIFYKEKAWKKRKTCLRTKHEPICKLHSADRASGYARLQLICDMAVCEGRPVTLETIDDEYGVVGEKSVFENMSELRQGVRKAIESCLHHGYDFLFLSCEQVRANKVFMMKQVLLLPPKIEKEVKESEVEAPRTGQDLNSSNNRETAQTRQARASYATEANSTEVNPTEANSTEANPTEAVPTGQDTNYSKAQPDLKTTKIQAARKPNINILVLDSVSRNHFFRSLPKTVSAMQRIDKDARILDFELFQSLAPFTFVNVQSFMSGKQDYKDIKNREIEFSVLFKRFKEEGYQTMMQEDACWYDKWGSIITSNKKRGKRLHGEEDFKKAWKTLKNKTRNYHVDNFGLSHFSCNVLEQYGRTNMFNDGNICFDGKPLSAHFLQYTSSVMSTQESTPGSKPQFTYTHLNIAHEKTGKRVRMLDTYLAAHIEQMSSLKNTLTILWSDHGAKTTKYAIRTLAGKFETFDAFLFMTVPSSLTRHIGTEAAGNLVSNQRAVVSVQDLHNSMMFLSRWKSIGDGGDIDARADNGIFSDKSHRTGCDELPMRRHALCKCADDIEVLDLSNSRSSYNVLWMSEYAMGVLNNKLNQQLASENLGYITGRSCKWLQGVYYRDAIREHRVPSSRYIFDVMVNHTETQVFNVQVMQSKFNTLSLFHWQRTSIYQTFDSCKDLSVSLELCICSRKRPTDDHLVERTPAMFGGMNKVLKSKQERCLKMIESSHHQEVKSYLIANSCRQKFLVEVFEIVNRGWWTSRLLPFKATLIGMATTFVMTARRQEHGQSEYEIGFKHAVD